MESRDQNKTFFHSLLLVRKDQNPFFALVVDGVLTTDPDVIKSHVIDFFIDLFSDLNNIILSLVSLQEIQFFEEIKLTAFVMDLPSAPHPDSFSGLCS